jgi:hypothetical protein
MNRAGRRGVPTRGPTVAPATRALLFLVVLPLLVPTLSAGPGASETSTVRHLSALPASVALRPFHGLHAVGHPSDSGSFYTQEGATVAQWDGSSSKTVLPTVRLTVGLANSPVSIGYELNGVSNAGDWYQLVVADNWPGCASGFEEVTEIWSNSGSTGPVTCDPTLTLHAGDLVELNLSFASGSSVCLGVVDRTTARSHLTCSAPPDTGGTGFTTLSGSADSNGFFTGPMTEIVNTTVTGCPDYSKLPTLAYSFLAPSWVSEFTPWADEFNYGGSGTYCFGNSPGLQYVPIGDPVTSYYDNAAGTGYGSRWGAAQNDSIRAPGTTFRYETDPARLLTVTASASSLLLAIGGSTTLTAVVSGGVPPYGALWTIDGGWAPNRNLSWTWNATAAGTTTFVAYGVDSQGDVVGPSNSVLVDIPGPLSVSRIFASPSSGSVDIGQTITLTVSANGGVAPYIFSWTGLPTGCLSANASTLSCTPTGAGTFAIELQLIDGNNTTVGSPTMIYDVVADPVAAFAVSASTVEVGLSLTLTAVASGGAGTLQYSWTGLPPGCAGTSNRIQCTPTGPGQFPVDLTVSDANGFALRLPALTVVVDPPVHVTLSATHTLADLFESIRLTASVSGGGGGYFYDWVGLPPGCMGVNASTLLCAPAGTGEAGIAVAVSDGLGGSSESAPVDLFVNPQLTVSLTSSSSSLPAGNALNVSAVVTGGSGGFAFAWTGLPSGCVAADAPSILCAPDAVGTTTVRVTVSDAAGQTSTANLTIAVTDSSSGLLSLGGSMALAEGILAVAAVVIVAAIVVLRRRREPD